MSWLDIKISDALFRIKDLYEKSDGKCYLSFSGGKDSTVVAHLIIMAQKKYNLPKIDFVFADTQVEYDAIYDFVYWFNDNIYNIEIIKPRKPFGQVIKEYGKPIISKQKSAELRTWHNSRNEASGAFSKLVHGKTLKGAYINNRLANKHFHLLHDDLEYKTTNICCSYVKKYPFIDYSKRTGNYNYFSGIHIGEGGAREHAYPECTSVNKIGIVHKMPIHDWTKNDINKFIEKTGIKISEAYTKYGLNRTGCIGCPFAHDIQSNLKALFDYEPNKYKAIMFWLEDVYIQQEVMLEFDLDYMIKLKDQRHVINTRRYEMLLKYRPEIAHKWKPDPQTTIF